MCGIVGILKTKDKSPVSGEILCLMRDELIHRGPDGAGLWMSPSKNIGLAHRRLSIVDLDVAANQPMCNEDYLYGLLIMVKYTIILLSE